MYIWSMGVSVLHNHMHSFAPVIFHTDSSNSEKKSVTSQLVNGKLITLPTSAKYCSSLMNNLIHIFCDKHYLHLYYTLLAYINTICTTKYCNVLNKNNFSFSEKVIQMHTDTPFKEKSNFPFVQQGQGPFFNLYAKVV